MTPVCADPPPIGQSGDRISPTQAPVNARGAISAAGNDAMRRVKDAVQARNDASAMLPQLKSPTASTQMRDTISKAIAATASSSTMRARAQGAVASGNAGIARDRDAMARRLAQALGLEQPDIAVLAGKSAPAASSYLDRPLLFVSSSMPIDELRTYAAQLEKAGGVMAFRGMPGGLTRVAPMAKLSAQILRLDPGCEGPGCAMRATQIIVDPIAFRASNITRVPALTMVPGDPTQAYCERAPDAPAPTTIVFGDAALSGMLDEYARMGGAQEVRDARGRLDAR